MTVQISVYLASQLTHDQQVVTRGKRTTGQLLNLMMIAKLTSSSRHNWSFQRRRRTRQSGHLRPLSRSRETGPRMAALAQALCEEVGLNWADDAARRIAQRAVLRASERQAEEGTRK